PLVCAMRTASRLNSSLCIAAISGLLDGEYCSQKTGTKPVQVQIVGRIDLMGEDVHGLRIGQRVGVPWLANTCGRCPYCRAGHENLCDQPTFTGYSVDGGYAEACLANARFIVPLDDTSDAASLAPLLCAGLIGYRALKMVADARSIGIYGFGAAAHIIAQIAVAQQRHVFAVTRPGDKATQKYALELGATWAGDSDQLLPEELDAALIFAPDGSLVPRALRAVRKGGCVVCAGIHMSQIPALDYEDLWGERILRSVANMTRTDAAEFMLRIHDMPVLTRTTIYALSDANLALDDLRAGRLTGAAVLVP
ncbi:alcohol dehydrogenase catalytic domain-containing protein, partial [Paracoccus nototheniae]